MRDRRAEIGEYEIPTAAEIFIPQDERIARQRRSNTRFSRSALWLPKYVNPRRFENQGVNIGTLVDQNLRGDPFVGDGYRSKSTPNYRRHDGWHFCSGRNLCRCHESRSYNTAWNDWLISRYRYPALKLHYRA